MDRAAAHRRLTEAGLDPARATALTELLWTVQETGELRDLDIVHLSDAGFRHLDVCIVRELLTAALHRRPGEADGRVSSLLGAFDAVEPLGERE